MKIDVVTPFPDGLAAFFSESMMKKAQEKGHVRIKIWNLRDFTDDKYKSVDDYPYGGGPGMILKPEPIFKAFDAIWKENFHTQSKVIFMTPQGQVLNQRKAEELSLEENLIFLCGHYRGVDERVIEALVTDEISIGDYILTGGELPAAVVIDAVVRLLPGVIGDFGSAEGDSFSSGLLDHPHYTRPETIRGMKVPDVLLSGHHEKIAEWRENQSFEKTKTRRPDLLENESF